MVDLSHDPGHGHVKPRLDGARARCGGPGRCPECSAEFDAAAAQWTSAVAAADAERIALYSERAHLVALLTTVYPSRLAYSDPATPEWAVVTVLGPFGLMCWHIAPGDLWLFGHLGAFAGDAPPPYDGHTTPEKYERLELTVAERGAAYWNRNTEIPGT